MSLLFRRLLPVIAAVLIAGRLRFAERPWGVVLQAKNTTWQEKEVESSQPAVPGTFLFDRDDLKVDGAAK